MSVLAEQARRFTYARQSLNRAARDADAVLRAVIGVHSTHPTAPLSLLARCAPFDAQAFRGLHAVRLPAMRGVIHLLPHSTAHLAFCAVPAAGEVDPAELGLSAQEYGELRTELLAAAADEPRSARELRAATGARVTLAPVLGALTREGRLRRVGAHGLRSNEIYYVADEVPAADSDQALAWLAGEYLRAFGPAREEDFAWWAGAPAQRARAALEAADAVDLADGMLLRAADAEAFERARPVSGTVDLLPRADCYTMGYPAGARERLAHPDVVGELYDEGGDSRPVVLVDGRAVGTWSVRAGTDLELEVELYEAPTPSVRRALDARAEEIRALLR